MSGGGQEMRGIARALLCHPRLMLLDEPSQGLAPIIVRQVFDVIVAMRHEGMSVLLVEHDMGFVMDLADRIVVLDFGTKIAEGTPQAIKPNPDVIKAYLGAGSGVPA